LNLIFITVDGARKDHIIKGENYEEQTKRVHLYDLKNDPFEDENIAEKNLNIVNQMEEIITKIQKSSKISSNKNPDNSLEIENELRKLGYL